MVGIIGGRVADFVLARIGHGDAVGSCTGEAYRHRSKLETLFGEWLWSAIGGKVVIDFGCGTGDEALEIARRGAAQVIGIDIRDAPLVEARAKAQAAGLSSCTFTKHTDLKADVIVSVDSFEHFDDPAAILRTMKAQLNPGGCVLAAFGPTWLHPLGGHLFSVFPWAHLVFTESALIRWRAQFKSDGARRFEEVEGGLNQLTIRAFERHVEASPLTFASFETVPIRRCALLAKRRLAREFFTSFVRCRLIPRSTPPAVSTAMGARLSSFPRT